MVDVARPIGYKEPIEKGNNMKLETPRDWWELLDKHWHNIKQCFELTGAPMTLSEEGHWWADGFGKEITRHEKPLIRVLDEAKETRDHEEMVRQLNLCWIAAPDKPYIHEWPSWYVLCDLCSECWVFDPEQQAAAQI
jgi:hypothetical protein